MDSAVQARASEFASKASLHLQGAIIVLGEDGTILSWNEGAESLFGYAPKEVVGHSIFDTIVPPDLVEEKRGLLKNAVAAGSANYEALRRRKDDVYVWVDVSVRVHRDIDGQRMLVLNERDITSSRHQREAQSLALQTAHAELEAFTYSVSHDLRAPIRQIEGFSKILGEHLGSDIDPQVEQYLLRIQEGSQQMGRLVDDLLHLAHLGRQHAKPRRISLDSLVDVVLPNVRADITDRNIEWKVNPLPTVVCDPGLMKVVFTNLLANAVKYTRPRENAVIEIGQLVKDGEPVVYVRDNGVGFDMKYADKLFGVFQRLHHAAEFEGTGIGLATVYRIIRKHNGTIWAEAAPDEGATFFFTLGGNTAGYMTGSG